MVEKQKSPVQSPDSTSKEKPEVPLVALNEVKHEVAQVVSRIGLMNNFMSEMVNFKQKFPAEMFDRKRLKIIE